MSETASLGYAATSPHLWEVSNSSAHSNVDFSELDGPETASSWSQEQLGNTWTSTGFVNTTRLGTEVNYDTLESLLDLYNLF